MYLFIYLYIYLFIDSVTPHFDTKPVQKASAYVDRSQFLLHVNGPVITPICIYICIYRYLDLYIYMYVYVWPSKEANA